MNRLIPGALYNPRDAQEQRLRMRVRGERSVGEPRDLFNYSGSWDRAADGFRREDPNGFKLYSLMQSAVARR